MSDHRAVSYQVRVDGNEVLPLYGRAAWIDQHGPIASELAVSLRASLGAWERFGATIKADGSIEVRDRVLLRQLQTVLCRELRREPKSVTRDQDETEALLEAARFAMICEVSPLPTDSFPGVGENYPAGTTPWFVPGDPRIPWAIKGKQYQFGIRVVYEPCESGLETQPPKVVAVDGPFELAAYETLPPVPPGKYGRLLARVVGED